MSKHLKGGFFRYWFGGLIFGGLTFGILRYIIISEEFFFFLSKSRFYIPREYTEVLTSKTLLKFQVRMFALKAIWLALVARN